MKTLLLSIVGALFLSLFFMPIKSIAAGLPTLANPQTNLNPPSPSWYTCYDTGNGTICNGKSTFEDFGGNDGTCPQGFDILENSFKEVNGARFYDRDHNLIQRVLHDVYPVGNPLNILYNSQTGKSVIQYGDVTETDNFAIPGDFSSMTARFTGNIAAVTFPSESFVLHDIGGFTFVTDGSIIEDRGPKMLFSGETEQLCSALN